LPNIKPFEEHAQEYEEWFEKNKFAYQSELKATKAVLPRFGKGVAIGAGSGQFAKPLGIGLGVEPFVRMGGLAKKREIEVVEGIAENLRICRDRGSEMRRLHTSDQQGLSRNRSSTAVAGIPA